MENYTKSRESACAQTKNMEGSFSSSLASKKALISHSQPLPNYESRKASSSESTASSVNCVTVSDSVLAKKKTKLSTKLTRTS